MGTGAIEIPSWLTQDFIEKILQNQFEESTLKIVEYNVTPANDKGDNYASILYRVALKIDQKGELENLSVITKVHPNGYVGTIAKKNELFSREIKVFSEILPKVVDLLDSISDFAKISPQCYHTSLSTDQNDAILVFEDMKVDNFTVPERGRLLNLEHALLVLEKLAKFHACSAVINERHPKIMDFFLEGPISANPLRQEFLGFFPSNMRSLAMEVAHWTGGYEEIAEKLFALEKTIIPRGVELFLDDDRSFRVLNHGDVWNYNLLFLYNDYVPEDVVLLDYQLSYFGSPGIDLNYFLYGSVNENVRKVHFKFMVREYHRILKDTLEKLKYRSAIPSLKDIHIELIRKSLQAVIASTCLTPIILMEPDKTVKLEELISQSEAGNDFRKTNIQNPKFKIYIQKLLKEFELSGFLD